MLTDVQLATLIFATPFLLLCAVFAVGSVIVNRAFEKEAR